MSGSNRNQKKRNVAVLLSGRGSNFSALLDATADPDFPCVITAAQGAVDEGTETVVTYAAAIEGAEVN